MACLKTFNCLHVHVLANFVGDNHSLCFICKLHLEMSNFEPAKVCLKKVLKLTENSQEVELLSKHLAVGKYSLCTLNSAIGIVSAVCTMYILVVRKIVHYALEVGRLCEDEVEERMRIYDKLGDLCCGVKAYTAAIEFYGKLVCNIKICPLDYLF